MVLLINTVFKWQKHAGILKVEEELPPPQHNLSRQSQQKKLKPSCPQSKLKKCPTPNRQFRFSAALQQRVRLPLLPTVVWCAQLALILLRIMAGPGRLQARLQVTTNRSYVIWISHVLSFETTQWLFPVLWPLQCHQPFRPTIQGLFFSASLWRNHCYNPRKILFIFESSCFLNGLE